MKALALTIYKATFVPLSVALINSFLYVIVCIKRLIHNEKNRYGC